MDKVYTNKIESFKNRYVNDVDTNFNLYLLNDISEAGEVDQLLDKQSWFLYYLEGALELNDLINTMLQDEVKHKEMLLESIKIKRVVDERLLELTDNDYKSLYADLGFDKIKYQLIQINDKKVNDKELFLKELWQELTDNKWIDSDHSIFNSNFIHSDVQSKINWVGKQYILIGLIRYLHDNEYIIYPKRPLKLIGDHFTFPNKPIKPSSLASSYKDVFDGKNISESLFYFIDDLVK